MFQKLRARIMLALALLAASASSFAAFHIVQINEVYSNASGSVQFIEIQMLASGQNFFSGQILTSSQGATTKTFTFPGNLANGNAGDSVLIGTSSYAALPGVPAPDFIVPDGFIFTSNVAINFAGVDFVTYATLPTDGALSVNHNGGTATNSPTNNSRVSGRVVLANPGTVPLAPTITSAATAFASGLGQTTIAFTPGANGGSAISGFTATCTAAGQTTRTASGTTSPLTVASLTIGVAYSCSVTATNAIGTSGASAAVTVTAPANATLTVAAYPLPPIVTGRTTTLTALVKMNSPAGTVTFTDNGVAITGCAQLPVALVPDATAAAVATCTVTAPTAPPATKQYLATYFYPAGHVSGRTTEQVTFDLRVTATGPADYTDMWWTGGNENGWGMSISQHGPIQFNVIFAYDNTGKSLWYVMPGGAFNAAGTVFTGSLYLPSSAPFSAYDKSLFAVGAPVGTATITYTSLNTATLAFTINGISATKSIQRQPLGTEITGPNLRVNDLWWATVAEDGWGMNIAQQGRVLFPVWYTYDAAGKATFFTAQGGSWSGTVWSGTVYNHTSAAWLGVPYNGSAFTATAIGTISLDFTDASTAIMTYTVNGFSQVKRIERQPY